jgi:hypothetical protein
MIRLVEQLQQLQEKKWKKWVETFEDEDTHEMVDVEREELLTTETSDEEHELWQQIIPELPTLSDEELRHLQHQLLSTDIDDTPIVEVLAQWGDGDALSQVGDIDWDDSDDPGEEDPSTYKYTLTGDTGTLNGIRKMIDDLCRDYGTPDNELGLFVPQRLLMKLLVGSDTEYYRGNVLHMEQPAPNQLVITTEADNGDPLLYALRECFDNLEITMKETNN